MVVCTHDSCNACCSSMLSLHWFRTSILMAPKQQPLSSLGVVARKGNGWRADMKISSSSRCRAPVRDSQKAAEEDLHLMRAAASRDDVPRVVKDLHDAGGGVATPSSMSDRPQEQNMPSACGNTILAIKAETSFKEETSSKRVRTTFPSERKHHLCPAGHCLVSVPGYEHEEGCQVSLCDIGHETDITSAPTTLDACHGAVTAPSWAHAILGTFDKAQLAQLEANCSSEDPITLGGDCMGGNAPWFAVTACQQAFRDQTGRRLVFKNTFGSEAPLPLGAAPLRFLQKNATPDTLFCDLKARTNSGDTFWPGGKQPCVRVKMYQSGWVCWDFSSANTLAPKQLDMVETSGSGESTKTLNGSLRYMSQFKPPVNLLENVFHKQALYGARAKLIAKDETDPFLKKKNTPKCL